MRRMLSDRDRRIALAERLWLALNHQQRCQHAKLDQERRMIRERIKAISRAKMLKGGAK